MCVSVEERRPLEGVCRWHVGVLQCIHNMSMWTSKNKELSYDQAKEDAKKAQKDVRLVSGCTTLTLFIPQALLPLQLPQPGGI